MRRGTTIAAAVVTAALAGAAPAAAAPECTLPKGVYTANAEYQYQTFLFTGQAEGSAAQLLGAVGTPTDRRRLEEALANVSRGNAARTVTFAGATVTSAGAVATALAADPPRCSVR